MNHSVPIYVGNPEINKDFIIKSFVYCESESDLERAIKEVEYLDTHDKEYIDMLMEYPINSKEYIDELYERLEEFLVSIFNQPKNLAYRRVMHYAASKYEKAAYKQYLHEKHTPKVINKIVNIIKGE